MSKRRTITADDERISQKLGALMDCVYSFVRHHTPDESERDEKDRGKCDICIGEEGWHDPGCPMLKAIVVLEFVHRIKS